MKTKIYTPDPLAKWSEKIDDSYGLSYAYLISKDWFNGGKIVDDCEYASRRNWIINKRLVARGEQDDTKYKEHIARQEGDLNYLNLDWRIINIPGKFCRIVANGIKDDYYNLDIRAKDRFTLTAKKKQMDEHRKNMRSLPMLKRAKEVLGVNLIPQGFIPEDETELALYSEIADRPKIEIAEQITIDYVKSVNNYDFIEQKKNKDLVEIGIAASRVWTDPREGIKMKYVDPEYLVHSSVEQDDFDDAYYYGYIDEITLSDIQRESDYGDATLRDIAESWAKFNNRRSDYDWKTGDMRDILDMRVSVLRFAFKTSKTIVYKKSVRNGEVVKMTKKDDNYDPPERKDYGREEDVKDTWMEGNYILDSEYIYGYKECENIIRDEQNRPVAPFQVRATEIYQNRLHSFLDDIEPLADQMQYIHLKIQHLNAEIKPDLVEIDIDTLAELPTKGDKKQTWEETLNIMNVKGVVFKKRIDMGEMGVKDQQATRPIPVNQGTGLVSLLNSWAHYYQLIRDTTGVNPARDGSLPHDALLGVNEMAQLASNTATQHIVEASIDFNKKICEVISTRIHQIFNSEGTEHLRKMYERAVGKQNIEALESMKDRHLHDFGFTVEMIPTQQEMKEFSEDLAIALQEGTIDVEIKGEAQRIAKTSMKLANQYLFFMRRKKLRERIEEEQYKMQMKSQGDIQAAQAATKSKTESYAIQKQIDLEYESQLMQLRLLEKAKGIDIERPKDDREFEEEVFLRQLDVAKDLNIKKYMEDRKDERTKIQATQQSKMVAQRQKENSEPIDFENTDIFKNMFG